MSYKIKDLNHEFSEDVIKEMLYSYKRGTVMYPFDIIVIDDAVFTKEGEYNDFGSIHKIRTIMFQNDSDQGYHDIFDSLSFSYVKNISIFEKEVETTIEEDREINAFLCDNINEILKDEYIENAIMPIYKLNKDGIYYGENGITRDNLWGTNIYLNKRYANIAKSYLNKDDLDIKICIQREEDIKMYKIHQTFVDDKFIWTSEKLDLPIWKLSDAAINRELDESSKKMTKK